MLGGEFNEVKYDSQINKVLPCFSGFQSGPAYQVSSLQRTVFLLPHQAFLYFQYSNYPTVCPCLQPLCHLSGKNCIFNFIESSVLLQCYHKICPLVVFVHHPMKVKLIYSQLLLISHTCYVSPKFPC